MKPVAQAVHAEAPARLVYMPKPQAVQPADDVAAVRVLYLPAPHATQPPAEALGL